MFSGAILNIQPRQNKQQQIRNLKIHFINKYIQKKNEQIKEYNKSKEEQVKKYNEYKNKYSQTLFDKLTSLQQKLKLDFGTFIDEYPEQMMVVRYFTGNEKVLEIGGNIGRNSLIIASILNNNNSNSLVTLESNTEYSQQLIHNKTQNNLDFFVENSALSKQKLIQQNWKTFASETLLDGYQNVSIINFEELTQKYNIEFDTLVLDCEGAFYYILLDMPEILNNIKLIIMENDYEDPSHKNYVDSVLKSDGFYIDYIEGGGWGHFANNFFEVWKK